MKEDLQMVDPPVPGTMFSKDIGNQISASPPHSSTSTSERLVAAFLEKLNGP